MSDDYFVWTPADIMRELEVKKSACFAKLAAAGLTGETGEYTTKQVLAAFYPDLKIKRAELLELQREEQKMRVEQMKGELVDAAEMRQALESIFIAIRQIIGSSDLDKKGKADVLANIAGLPVVFAEGVKRSQAKLRYEQPEKLERTSKQTEELAKDDQDEEAE